MKSQLLWFAFDWHLNIGRIKNRKEPDKNDGKKRFCQDFKLEQQML